MTVHYLTEESDWKAALDTGMTLERLRANVGEWEPFVPDAAEIVAAMDGDGFERWRAGLATERQGAFAGEPFAVEFGALLIPGNLIRASQLSHTYHVPLGCALIKMAEASSSGDRTRGGER